MSDDVDKVREQTFQTFQKTLNLQGYGFQHSVLKTAQELRAANKSAWIFEAAEFPVEVQGKGTRIDFILSHQFSSYGKVSQLTYMIAECKRANPAVSDWCFITAPYTTRDGNAQSIATEGIQLGVLNNLYSHTRLRHVGNRLAPYHLAVEVKSDKRGDAGGQRPEAIEEAASQVCRGLNGLVQMFRDTPQFVGKDMTVFLLPVIFTTAQIWASDADLSSADLLTGNIDLTIDTFKKMDWLLYNYNVSPGLKHSLLPYGELDSLSKVMEAQYVRTIPVVSAAGVADFLDWAGELTFS